MPIATLTALREIYWELLTVSTRFTYLKYCIRGKNTVKINYLHLSNEFTFFQHFDPKR